MLSLKEFKISEVQTTKLIRGGGSTPGGETCVAAGCLKYGSDFSLFGSTVYFDSEIIDKDC